MASTGITEAKRRRIRLGDLLVEHGVITADQLSRALAEQKRTGTKLGRTLIELGYVSERETLEFLSRQLGIPLIDLQHYHFEPEVVRRLPETHARRFRAIVLKAYPDSYLVGMADPTDIFAFDELQTMLGGHLEIAVVQESALLRTFDTVYRRTQEISNIAQELGEEVSEGETALDELLEGEDVNNAPVVRLLRSLFEDAVQVGASDIHIEPDHNVLRIRQRIDGMLHEQVMNERQIAASLVLRLKLMSGLNISERRLPQDGRFNTTVKGRSIDVRVSTMPVQHGESVVLRLLDQSSGMLDLGQLGMPEDMLQRLQRVLRRPTGLVLVTGPTGSGKTTTLYAALQRLNEANRKIITVEDPVEYRLPRVSQVQVNTKIGLEFARVLRSALRQDPDIILVGEMRDPETVEMGLRASMTGHLVLSTLHTNDAAHTVDRLVDMGAPGYLIAASLRAVIAQRLLRRVCTGCATTRSPEPRERAWLEGIGESVDDLTLVEGRGCPHCGDTGYRGRVGVYEYVEPDERAVTALRRNDLESFHDAVRARPNYESLLGSALALMRQGVIPLAEVMRLAGAEFDVEAEV